MIVQEVYIGRIQEIEEIFQEFKELRHTYKVWKSKNTAKRTAKIEKMIEDLWGFKAFCLNIDPDSTPNAYTYPVSTSIDINPDMYMITNSKGYRYSEKARVCAISSITAGMFCNKTFTDEEVFAAFLHEIGHSFVHRSPYIAAQQDVYKSMLIVQIIYQIIFGLISANPLMILDAVQGGVASTNFYKRVYASLNKAVKKVPVLRNVIDFSKLGVGFLKGFIQNTIYTILTGIGISALSSKLSKWEYDEYGKNQIKLTGHQNAYARSSERLSDDFATMYGFGSYLSSALVKMENPDNQGLYMKIIHRIPLIGKIFKYSDAAASEINGLLSAHPSSADRILNILNSMEKDLKNDKDIPDKVKKEMRINIKQQKDLVEDLKSECNENLKNRNEYMQALVLLGLTEGDSEDFIEKRYTDRKQLKRFYDERKNRSDKIWREQTEIDTDYLALGLDELI